MTTTAQPLPLARRARSALIALVTAVALIGTYAMVGVGTAAADPAPPATPARADSAGVAQTYTGNRLVGLAATADDGYVTVTAQGDVYAFNTRSQGSPRTRHIKLKSKVVGIAAMAKGGYVVATARGDVYAFETLSHGSPRTRGIKLKSKVVGIAATPKGGYVVATARGDVFAFGTKKHGSPRARHGRLKSKVVGIAATAKGGYVVATARGDVFAFGTKKHGSLRTRGIKLKSKVVGIAAPAKGGYLLATARGDVYAFGTKNLGSPRKDQTHLGSTLVGITATADGGYLTAAARGDVYAFGTVSTGVGDGPSCAPPVSSTTPLPGAPANLAGSGLGASAGGTLLKMLGEGAFIFAEDEGLGWVMNLVGGLLGDNEQQPIDPAHIDEQFADANTKITALQNQTYTDCLAVQSAIAQLSNKVDQDAYTTQAGLAKPFVTEVGSYTQLYANVLTDLTKNGGSIAKLSDADRGYLEDMRVGDNSKKSLPDLVDQINGFEADSGGGTGTMISLYNKVLKDTFGYDPYATHIFPAEFVNAAYAQQAYYASVLTQATYMYANVAHLTFTSSQKKYGTDGTSVAQLVNRVQADIQSWSAAFSDGDGPANWVSQGTKQLGIGTMAPDTVLDYRVSTAPRLWTDKPAALAGDPTDPAPSYCATTAAFCYANRYDAAGHVASTTLARPSAVPLQDSIDQQGHDGLTGWRIPTSTDWTTLQQGSTGSLSAWGTAHQLHIFDATPITSGWNGTTAAINIIPPVLVNTGTVDEPTYGVLSAADGVTSAGTPPTALASVGGPFSKQENPDAQSALGGRLFLTQDFQPTAPPPPFSDSGAAAPAKAPSTSAGRGRTQAVAPGSAAVPTQPHRASVQAVPGPTTFSTPTSCQAAAKYVVPDGAAAVQITTVGAAGTDSHHKGSVSGAGGLGGTVSITVPAPAGSTLYVQVGGNSSSASDFGYLAGGPGGGGSGGTSQTGSDGRDFSGGGGGASVVSTAANCSAPLAVAGGGGGGGSGVQYSSGGRGGDACVSDGRPCQLAQDGDAAWNKTQYAGKAGGNVPGNHGGDSGHALNNNPPAGVAGATLQGGSGASANDAGGGGGGGGGGYPGGGGGGGAGDNLDYNGGGGGGGGGGTFGIPSFASQAVIGLGSRGQTGSVTLTPIAKVRAPISIAASATPSDYGAPLSLVATLPAFAYGVVSFYDDVDNGCETNHPSDCVGLGSAPNQNGRATLDGVNLSVGLHRIRASYPGGTYFATSNATPITVTIKKGAPALTLSIQGTVLWTKTGPTAPKALVVRVPADATGYVGFYDLSTTGGPDTVIGSAPIVHGSATLTTLRAPLGVSGTDKVTQHTIRASSSGDRNYVSTNSNKVVITVGVVAPDQ